MRVQAVARGMLASAVCLAASGAIAQPRPQGSDEVWPSKPVRWVLPYSAGSGPDIMGRQIGPKLAERLGQPVIIENRAGAGGVIGFGSVAKAAPDGYHIMMGNNSLLILSGLRPTPYDPLKDFAPVTLMGIGYNMLMVNQSIPVNSVAELVAYSKANPGKLNYSSPSSGTFAHLNTELFKMHTGADLVHIPYKGIGAAVQAMATGDVALVIAGMDLAVPFVKAGKVKVLAVAGEKRSPMYPDLPTAYELGYSNFRTQFWYGLLVPTGTRRDIVAKLNAEMSNILAERELRESLMKRGIDTATSTPEEFAQLMKSEMATWQRVIKEGSLKPD